MRFLLRQNDKTEAIFIDLIALLRLSGNSKKGALQTAIVFCIFALQIKEQEYVR